MRENECLKIIMSDILSLLRRIFLAYYVSLYTLDLSRKMSGQKLVEYSVNKGKPSQGIGTLGTGFFAVTYEFLT